MPIKNNEKEQSVTDKHLQYPIIYCARYFGS